MLVQRNLKKVWSLGLLFVCLCVCVCVCVCVCLTWDVVKQEILTVQILGSVLGI